MAKERRTDAERRARQCERIGRVLRVLQLVMSRGESWGAEKIARELEVSERTVFRDIQTLQLGGVPIYHDEQQGGYRVRPGFDINTLTGQTGAGDRARSERPSPELAPEQLAEAALNAAGRLLSDAQELVGLLTRLRDTLGRQESQADVNVPHRRRRRS